MFDDGILNVAAYITGKTQLNLLAERILPDLVTESSLPKSNLCFFLCGTLKCEEEVDHFLTVQ